MSQQEFFIKALLTRELESSIYDYKIGGVEIYNYLYRFVRIDYLRSKGFLFNGAYPKVPMRKKDRVIRALKSLGQILWAVFFVRRDNVIYTFRLDKVNGMYLDKFTDPVIDDSDINKSYIIMETPNTGVHEKPRCHDNSVIYMDFVQWFVRFCARRFPKQIAKKHESEYKGLWERIDYVMQGVEYDKKRYKIIVEKFLITSSIYAFIFKKLKAKTLIAASKTHFPPQLFAAKLCGMKVCELQHGLIWGDTLQYTVPDNELFVPDVFMLYGNMCPAEKFGVPKDRVKLLGYAFLNYIKSKSFSVDTNRKRVLIISDPTITGRVVDIVCELADRYGEIEFDIRPHPMELFSDELKEKMRNHSNIVVVDNKDNILVALNGYESVLVGNSTVAYEASALGKKVGKFYYPGFSPEYINEADEGAFWHVFDYTSFEDFLFASSKRKEPLPYYSSYNRKVMNDFLKG